MDDSIAHPSGPTRVWEAPAWKTMVSAGAAFLLAALMLVAGVWKTTDPVGAATRLHQALVPAWLSLPGALALGIAETFAGVLLVVPRFRRWGAWLSALLLVAFLIYIGINYSALQGEECNCFPWIQRAVGPAFFIGDLVMLGLAALAGVWARRSEGMRGAALVLAAVCVFAGVSYGVNVTQQGVVRAPKSIAVEGRQVALDEGRVLLYFFDPECTHCYLAAREMGTYKWNEVKVIGVPTERAQFAPQFMQDTGLNAPYTTDAAKLRETFRFGDPPYAVALEHGQQVAAMTVFEGDEPQASLRQIGFIP
ncbi:MAG: hypothetical protein KIT09_34360 [Bryobacteraceae bacterium]|nr:hypothetical protein [Bryobacteraceae bacterium]